MLFDKLIGIFSHDISIDLGTANTIVMIKGKGVVINEPSVVAIQHQKHGKAKVLTVGKEAKEMVGKTPGSIQAIRPLKDGVIADIYITEKMIRYFIEKAHDRTTMLRPRIIICVPYGVTDAERKIVKESVMNAGAREVFLIEEPMAAAIGAGLPVKEPKGNLVVDIGGGTTELGVVSLGGLVISKSLKVAGDKLDMNIVDHIKKKYNLVIGERTGEKIKIEIGSAVPIEELSDEQKENTSMIIKGRDQNTNLLHSIEITSDDVKDAMSESLNDICEALKDILENTPPDLASDIVDNGIVLTGGGALIRGLDKYLSQRVKLPVYVADEPLLAVAKGTYKTLEEIDILQQLAY